MNHSSILTWALFLLAQASLVQSRTPLSELAQERNLKWFFGLQSGLPARNSTTLSERLHDIFRSRQETLEVQNLSPIRINCGSLVDYTDVNGNVWEADDHFSTGGLRYSRAFLDIGGTDDDGLYRSNRYSWTTQTSFSYDIPVDDGTYEVTLLFAEVDLVNLQESLFDVKIEDTLVYASLDVSMEAGGDKTALQKTSHASVQDGMLTITLEPVKGNAFISAIQVVRVFQSSPSASPSNSPSASPKSIPTQAPVSTALYPPTPRLADTGDVWTSPEYTIGKDGFSITETIDTFSLEDITISASISHDGDVDTGGGPKDTLQIFYQIDNGSEQTWLDIVGDQYSSNAQVTVTSGSTLKIRMVGDTTAPDEFYYVSISVSVASGVSEPIQPPGPAPTPVQAPAPAQPEQSFKPVLINVGGGEHTDYLGRKWMADQFFTGGQTYSKSMQISDTQDDILYQSERWGEFKYEIPLPVGNYEIMLHFAEIFFFAVGQRVFVIDIDGKTVWDNVDLIKYGSGQNMKALTLETVQVVSDDFLTIEFKKKKEFPKLSGIELNLVGPHLAHAVAGGPYLGVDTSNNGFGMVPVDGSTSHTHGVGLQLKEINWKLGQDVIGTGETPTLKLPVGEHTVTLFVVDTGGNENAEETTITVLPYGFPEIDNLSKTKGLTDGGDQITMKGSGFSSDNTIVHFGTVKLTGSDINVVNDNIIKMTTPASGLAVPVIVTVETAKGVSNGVTFTYVEGAEIQFNKKENVAQMYSPTSLAFGPDEKLYVGCIDGTIVRMALDENYNVVDSVATKVLGNRAILGITFDPMDMSDTPCVYVSHSKLFHGGSTSTSGQSINGKVSAVCGANLDNVNDVITGLPVCDHDHGVNGLEFGDNGELYVQVGGNTNQGIPGKLSGSQLQKESPLSAATLVAYLSDPNFSGSLTYTKDDDGDLKQGSGVEVFAAGNRNPFDIVLHSNGFLYGTDNGPNAPYGPRATGCDGSSFLPGTSDSDKINLLVKGAFYGHPNLNRGKTDPRQCVWRSPYDGGTNGYTPPILATKSATTGIMEFRTDHFDGQLRGNLIFVKYKSNLNRIILTENGKEVHPQSDPALSLGDGNFLDVTQGPDGCLFMTTYNSNQIEAWKPIEAGTSDLVVKGVFPNRGPKSGGSMLRVYGVNLNQHGTPTVKVGGSDCPVKSVSSTKIVCKLPGGSGTSDVVVTTPSTSWTFYKGYRFISGVP